MDTLKKILRFLSSILFYSIMLILVVVLFMFLSYFIDQKIGQQKGEKRSPLFGAYVIISTSMIPNINVYDAVVTMRVKQDQIEVNDIITFISKEIDTAGTPITHRVIGIVDTETGIKYRTKGDNNNTADFALISPNEVIGKVYLRIPMIGYVQTFIAKPIGWICLVVIPCLLIIGSDIFKLFLSKIKKENNMEQKNQSSLGQSLERISMSNSIDTNTISSFSNSELTQNSVDKKESMDVNSTNSSNSNQNDKTTL